MVYNLIKGICEIDKSDGKFICSGKFRNLTSPDCSCITSYVEIPNTQDC